MKRITFLLLSALWLMSSLDACGNQEQEEERSEHASLTSTEYAETSERINSQESTDVLANNSILIVYFSRYGNTEYPDYVDATTSASIVTDENGRYGTTEYVANLIQQTVGGDVHRIETATPYTADFDELRDVNHEEMEQEVLPELKESNLDISVYDAVFIGYPVWANSVPQAVLSFLNEYDLSGKTVVPFCTHDGYGAGDSYQVIKDASHAAVSPEGIAIEAKDVPAAQNTITDWLTAIDITDDQEKIEISDLQGTKILVAYFSPSNTTESVAEYIANGLDADIYEIIPEVPGFVENMEPHDIVLNMKQYDIVFVGYPIWLNETPGIISTFMESYDFSGKTIVPFCTSDSNNTNSGTSTLKRLTNGAKCLDEQCMKDCDSQNMVLNWVNSLNLDIG